MQQLKPSEISELIRSRIQSFAISADDISAERRNLEIAVRKNRDARV